MQKLLLPLLLAVVIVSCRSAGEEKEDKPRQVKQYTIEQFYKSTLIGGGAFSSDDKTLLVSSNESGIYNAYEIDIASGSRKQLTSSQKESIFANDYVPGSKAFIYSSDKGGNENDHLILMKPDSSIKDLTPDEKEKAQFAGWSRDNTKMYFLSNRRDPRYFDLYSMDTASSGVRSLILLSRFIRIR